MVKSGHDGGGVGFVSMPRPNKLYGLGDAFVADEQDQPADEFGDGHDRLFKRIKSVVFKVICDVARSMDDGEDDKKQSCHSC